jgi:hypothetical protein
MKKILVAFALVSTMAAPVYAKTVKHTAPATQGASVDNGADYVGQDPDPRIQSELNRDPAADRI